MPIAGVNNSLLSEMSASNNTITTDLEEYYKYYHFRPSLAAACLFAILFGVSTLWHMFLIAKRKTWYFIPLLIGGICM